MVDSTKYVVLDIETNGLYVRDDILSISIYKPDDGTSYSRFLPLELASRLNPEASSINGITMADLDGAQPLTQADVDEIIETFELDRRQVLTYGEFDKRMLKHYFLRKGLRGFERFDFFNFKERIISSRFAMWDGINISKDNMCRLYGIDGVEDVHTSLNDCVLEWKLFERMDGKWLFVTENKVFEMNHDYIVPAGYFNSHPKLKHYVPNFPRIYIEPQLVKRFELSGEGVRKCPLNWNGIAIEHLINQMVGAERQDSLDFLVENKGRLQLIGKLPCTMEPIPVIRKEDGTLLAVKREDEAIVGVVNRSTENIKKQLEPIVEFIKSEIFGGEKILSQELVIHEGDNTLALCDLSTRNAILEIKTRSRAEPDECKEQLYYEANGRECYLLRVNWSRMPEIFAIEILKIAFLRSKPEGKKSDSRKKSSGVLEPKDFESGQMECLRYDPEEDLVILRCRDCLTEWEGSARQAVRRRQCRDCKPAGEERDTQRRVNYLITVMRQSDMKIEVWDYTAMKNDVHAKCRGCGHQWQIRAARLLSSPHCPNCGKKKG
jgi:DNA polymerase III epsilon subunit-like protein